MSRVLTEEITTDVFFGLYQYEVCNSVNSTSSCSVHSYDKRSDNAANEHCFYSGYTAALLLLLGIASNLLAAFLLYNRTGSSCASLFGCFCWVLAGVVWYLACWLRASDFVVLQDSPEVEDRVGMAVYLLAVGIVFGLFAGLTGLCMPQRSRFHTPW